MSLSSAGTFLVAATVKNRVLLQIRRLRQPKYFVATAAGLAYLAAFVMGRGRAGSWSPTTPGALPVIELGLAVLAIFFALSGWVFGSRDAALQFSEAEIQLLFPAPVSRRALLHYKLVRNLLVAFASACLVSIFVGARFATHREFFLLGAWLGVSTLSMHWTAASLTRASFVEPGTAGLRRQVVTACLLGVALLVLVLGLALAPMPNAATLPALGAWASSLADSSPIAWVLLPARAPIRVALARSAPELLPALPAAIMVAALHYVWVLSSGTAFEQASLERAERRATKGDVRRDPGRILRRSKPLFKLHARGAPWVGLFWKNLLAATRLLSLRLMIALAILLVGGAVTALGIHGPGARFGVFGVTCAAAAVFLALLGPQALRIDLRLDLARMDLLRSYPLLGRDIVAAEVLAPAAVLAAAEWMLLAAATILSSSLPAPTLGWLGRIAVAVAAGILLPIVTTCGLVVQNAAVLLFPGWVGAEMPGRGIEAVGQRLLTLAGGLVVIAFGLVPASFVGGLVAALLWSPMGIAAVPLASAAAALVVAAEINLVLGLLGRAFERFDLSQ